MKQTTKQILEEIVERDRIDPYKSWVDLADDILADKRLEITRRAPSETKPSDGLKPKPIEPIERVELEGDGSWTWPRKRGWKTLIAFEGQSRKKLEMLRQAFNALAERVNR